MKHEPQRWVSDYERDGYVVVENCLDPQTLARDVARLEQRSFRLVQLRGFDLMPQTHHVETVAHLSRF